MIIGLCGQAGAGKDTVADFLVKNHSFVKVALADVLKRAAKEFFDFSDEQLWGPSSERNKPDPRYRRKPLQSRGLFQQSVEEVQDIGDQESFGVTDGLYLTPRHALQQLGTEFGRACYSDVWVNYALRVAAEVLKNQRSYSARHGVGQGAPGIKPSARKA